MVKKIGYLFLVFKVLFGIFFKEGFFEELIIFFLKRKDMEILVG